ncbi:MAG: hypothetical protein RR877_09560 [Aurantimicrobium sp.]|uniref:hypothetical protein n=1 Tax=Aurantimicrobium sp. TaxID=1930784 RepID=UPI002FC9AD96
MDEFLPFVIGIFLATVVFISVPDWNHKVTYPMMVRAEKTCYSNHGIKDVASFGDKSIVVRCNNGAKFEFEEGDYRNE